MKKLIRIYTIILLLFLSFTLFSQDASLKLHYTFSNIGTEVTDQSGNGYHGVLKNGAVHEQIGDFSVLNLGSQNGYADMTANTGKLIGSLTNFSIAFYVYVEPQVDLSQNGNFICTFANSTDMARTANGNMFMIAKNTRYAISKTHWQNETSVSANAELEKGTWKHMTYTQDGNSGRLFVDGNLVKTNNVLVKPADLGETGFNFIGRSCYASDVYLKNSYLNDFRIYERALTQAEISSLASQKLALNNAINMKFVEQAKAGLIVSGLDSVVSNLELPSSFPNGVSITWQSSEIASISNNGIVNRPPAGSNPVNVILTAIFSKGGISVSKDFQATVIPFLSELESVKIDSTNLQLSGNLSLLRSDLSLPASGKEGSSISWTSSNPTVLSNAGIILSRPPHGSGNAEIQLTATITKDGVSKTKIFTITVAEDEGFSGYLFSYFTGNSGNQEAIRFALSDDGFTFTALNNNEPVLKSADISSTGGVRDPHLLRGENNDYYMVVTDMVSAWGWSSNRAMVLLKSSNLIDWSSTVINIPNTFPEYVVADRIWAPQTIFDPSVGKYMVYFSMRLGPADYDKIYYAYANCSFTALESAPRLLFENNGKSVIDGDIVFFEGKYHLFFKTEGSGNGIKKAVSENLTSGYVLYDKYLQSTSAAVEGGCVYRMYNSDKWMLIYDMYTSGAYQFTESFNLQNFTVTPNPISFNFAPRHGTIIPITVAEKQALKARWNGTSVDKVMNEGNIKVFPSLTDNQLTLHFENDINSEFGFRMFDVTGKMMMDRKITSNGEKYSISHIPNGLYIILIYAGNNPIHTQKVIVRR